MYHSHFRGTHYEIGFRWGSLLLRHKNIILNHIPFQITQERIDFALSCIPIYKKYFPEILDEIQGIADGQACSVQLSSHLSRRTERFPILPPQSAQSQ